MGSVSTSSSIRQCDANAVCLRERALKKGSIRGGCCLAFGNGSVSAAVAGGAATGAGAAGTEINGAGKPEADVHEIYFDGFDLFDKFGVHQIGESIDVVNRIRFFWLIQSQGQAWPASAAGVEENANRRGLFVLEILSDLLGRCRGDFNHYCFPPYENWAGTFNHLPRGI